MSSTNFIMQIVEPDSVSADNYKASDNSYSFPYTVLLTVPMPAADGFSGINSIMVDGGRNANGDFEGAVIGQPKHKIDNFNWKGLKPAVARPLLQYFNSTATFVFYARFYDLISGAFIIRKFYRGDLSYEPHRFDPDTGDVDYFTSIKMNIIEV